MPYLRTGSGKDAADIYYEVHGELAKECGALADPLEQEDDQRPSVVLIMGFACTLGCWGPQLDDLLRAGEKGRPPVRALVLDNRGVGRSSARLRRRAYSTTLMAQDILALLKHLRWGPVHVVGHSLGGMIATRLAVLAPERVASLTLVCATAGGWQSLPCSWRVAKYGLQMLFSRSAEDRAKIDLKLHFMRKTLNEVDRKHGRTRRELLREEYVEGSKHGGIGQPSTGFRGQLLAVWRHSVSERDARTIVNAGIPVLVLHGRHDIVAAPRYGEALARRLEAPCVMLEGAHFLTRERGPEVCQLLRHIILHGRRLQERPYRYLDRASVEGGCGALAAVTELRLAAPVREDSESSSATCGDSPTSTIQLIVKRDS